AEDVAGVEERPEHLIEMEVRTADRGGGDLDDGIGGLFDDGVWNILDAHLALALPCECLHLRDDRHPGQDGTGDGASGITVITARRGTVRMPGLSGSGQRSPRWRGAWSKITL